MSVEVTCLTCGKIFSVFPYRIVNGEGKYCCVACVPKCHSEETKRKISERRMGIKFSEEHLKNLRKSHEGNVPWNKGKKGLQVAWNKGQPLSEKQKKLLSVVLKGRVSPNKGKTLSDAHKKHLSESHKGQPGYWKGKSTWSKGKHFTEEHKRKISESQKGRPGKSGKDNPAWKGGISFEPYCHKFNDAFKESIRDKFNRECFLCSKNETDNGKKLSVHHVNYDKNCLCGDAECEFVPLCQSCHAKTNHNRDCYENHIIEKLNNMN